MKKLRILSVLCAISLMASSVYAMEDVQSVQGKITSINPNEKQVTITPSSPSAGLPNEMNLEVKDQASFKNAGIQSLNDLSVGDEIVVQAHRKMNGKWEVKSLQRASSTLAPAATTSTSQTSEGADVSGTPAPGASGASSGSAGGVGRI